MDKMTTIFVFQPYTPDNLQLWDECVASSRNGTFLLKRTYMDYHADRFTDASLIALKGNKPVALLPACRLPDDTLSSHAGLTYGGWLLPAAHLDGAAILTLLEEWVQYCRSVGFKKIVYKPIPYIYHTVPTQEDIYALWRLGFEKTAVNLSSAIDLRSPWKFNMSKRQQVRKARTHNIQIERSEDYALFWHILCECLVERHEAAPVHSLEEIIKLKTAFPENIKLYTLSDEQGMQAGVCIYDTGRVVHSQYAATTARARERFYLTALYHFLLTEVFVGRDYFDFGTSNEQAGKYLNAGLLNQKYSMGATGVVYEQYSLAL
ncbi:MAG: GNAT family N-acetyltransferase [Prevotella sp.]|nr:GNAT family N-acetyltransferase [Prevotella sp.]MCM1075420.1 GNAT family N-acetyltransferase [Ruminococcus sp.]